MPHFPLRSVSSRFNSRSFSSGWITSKYRLGRSKPVTVRTGWSNFRIFSTSFRTCAVAVAVYTLLGRIVREENSTSVYTFIVYTACAVALLLVCFVQNYGLADYGFSAVIVGFLLALFSTILGHSIFSWCLKFFSPSFVSASKLCEPVVAAVIAGFLFTEIPSVLQFFGGVLILGGVYSYSRIERKEK